MTTTATAYATITRRRGREGRAAPAAQDHVSGSVPYTASWGSTSEARFSGTIELIDFQELDPINGDNATIMTLVPVPDEVRVVLVCLMRLEWR